MLESALNEFINFSSIFTAAFITSYLESMAVEEKGISSWKKNANQLEKLVLILGFICQKMWFNIRCYIYLLSDRLNLIETIFSILYYTNKYEITFTPGIIHVYLWSR